ncbi:hypothetical protein FGG08_003970 [Glutinoglossum americanum]|uniref:Uncharacterized protein n=1 Tax=Glutinoglossum americanum TaxID=1670608 RepID=A0A9P8I1E4_9PEZI|nr:hypothetical protein FGG08_003970 [Glutinoglossum americanum]
MLKQKLQGEPLLCQAVDEVRNEPEAEADTQPSRPGAGESPMSMISYLKQDKSPAAAFAAVAFAAVAFAAVAFAAAAFAVVASAEGQSLAGLGIQVGWALAVAFEAVVAFEVGLYNERLLALKANIE